MLIAKKRLRGATLLELMIGIAILGILLIAAAPSFSAWITNTKIRTAAESIQNGLQIARNEAMRRNTNVAFRLDSGSSWSIFVVSTAEKLQTRAKEDGSTSNVTVIAVPAGSTTVTYTALGRIAPANLAAPVTPFTRLNIDVPISILSAADSKDLAITASSGGQIKMCDPNVSTASDPRKC